MTGIGYDVLIQGFVQGQGVRPALARLADKQHWSGSVRNTPQGVLVALDDVTENAADVERLIRNAHAALATASIAVRTCDGRHTGGFRIEESATNGDSAAPAPRDVAVCADCLREFHDERDRRFRYGLISCTRCGPRFSILEAMPFDRSRTTLAGFPLCGDCQCEYESRDHRRCHAQTIGCPRCGPQVWAGDRKQRIVAANDDACQLAADSLLQGRIVALRGIGGYQLLVDATNETAVKELRRRKRRATKPFAVLCRTMAAAESIAVLDGCARQALASPANPIVIVPWRVDAPLAAGVHPHLADIGLLLSTTAVHDRLLQLVGRPLVCTSGNMEGAPLAVTVEESHESLADIADLWLHHDRPIASPIDDSVVRPMAGRAVTIRCARGLAPLPLELPHAPPMVALGGFQKSAVAWSNGAQAALGPHIGDLNDLHTRERLRESVASVSKLYGLLEFNWAVDGHPDDFARRIVPPGMKPIVAWHHHAHIAAAMLEHGWLEGPVLGIAADGQGFGPDGKLWGGEALWATATSFRRIALVRPYALLGGEAAVRDSGRVAISLLSQLQDLSPKQIAEWTRCDRPRSQALLQTARASLTPWTSSLGRLFDGVAWIVLGMEAAGYIGEPAMRWEAACDPSATGSYAWAVHTDRDPWELDWHPMLREVLSDLHAGASFGVIAERFHRGIVGWMLEMHRRCPPRPMVVGGGVFQNRRLCELLQEQWPTNGPPLGLPGAIPPNDGGLAAGQLAIAAARWHSGQSAAND